MSKYIPISKIREMSDDELVKLSMERNSRNLLTQNAEHAMKVRRERSGAEQWRGVGRKTPSYESELISQKGSNFTKKFR